MKIHILLITATVILLSASQVKAVEYEVVILGTLGGEYSYAYAINDSGQVVGQSYTSDNQIRAFLWDKDNGMQNLGVLEIPGNPGQPYYSCATGINNSGQIVGYSGYYDGPERAFLWENGQMCDLGSLGGTDSHATGINNQGQIVGYSKNSNGDIRAFLWHNGIMQDIGTLEGRTTYAHGINDNGQVIGESYTSNGYNAFIWDNGIMNNLGTINQYGSVAKGINNSGQITGSITPEKIYIRQEAVLWDNNSITALGYLDANDPRSYGQAINEPGQIVGFSLLRIGPSNPGHACLWENCEIVDLDIYFPENIHANYAYGINNSGQIVGCIEIGGRRRAFLMTPIPEPTTRLVPAEYPTIQSAIDACNDGDEVVVAPGTYTGDGNRDINFLGKAITVRSENGPETCIIDCNGTETNPHRGFYFHSGENQNSVLDGFTITNGYMYGYPEPDNYGGGICCEHSSPTITNCIITRNSAGWAGGGILCNFSSNPMIANCTITENWVDSDGGGIFCYRSSPTIINCVIKSNIARFEGGGVYCHENSCAIISNCTITGNVASYYMGGGIMCRMYSSPTIVNCTIANNSSENDGGGICCSDSNPTIVNSIVISNTAKEDGGGLYNCFGPVTDCTITGNTVGRNGGGLYRCDGPITNCTISGNKAGYGGGAIYCSYRRSTISNCIISGNIAENRGGAIYCYNSSNATLTNCTITENSASNGSALACDSRKQQYPSNLQMTNSILWDGGDEVFNEDNSAITITYSDVQGGYEGQGNINADPCLVEPGYWADVNDPNIIVEPNDPKGIWVDGDYHLKSEGWRWDIKRNRWTYDDVTSRCIDAGNPGSPLGEEPLSIPDDPNNIWGQNLRINMGAYGGTTEASMPPYDWAILGDLTNDGLVNFEDYAFQAANWLNSADQQPGDLNRDSLIDISDLALLVEDWLRQTTWHE